MKAGSLLDLNIHFVFSALLGDAWCAVVARWKPEAPACQLEAPGEWLLNPVWVDPTAGFDGMSVVHLAPNEPLPPGGAPNMHRGETWRGTDVNEDDAFDAIAVAADPGGDAFDAIAVAADPNGGGAHRIALARQSSELYYSDDNGATFYPLGSEDAGTQQVGAAEEASLAEALRWRTTGLESMSVHGFYQLPSPGPREPGRLFTFANDGGVFFSDDNGETWVWAQTNVSSRRLGRPPGRELQPSTPSRDPSGHELNEEDDTREPSKRELQSSTRVLGEVLAKGRTAPPGTQRRVPRCPPSRPRTTTARPSCPTAWGGGDWRQSPSEAGEGSGRRLGAPGLGARAQSGWRDVVRAGRPRTGEPGGSRSGNSMDLL